MGAAPLLKGAPHRFPRRAWRLAANPTHTHTATERARGIDRRATAGAPGPRTGCVDGGRADGGGRGAAGRRAAAGGGARATVGGGVVVTVALVATPTPVFLLAPPRQVPRRQRRRPHLDLTSHRSSHPVGGGRRKASAGGQKDCSSSKRRAAGWRLGYPFSRRHRPLSFTRRSRRCTGARHRNDNTRPTLDPHTILTLTQDSQTTRPPFCQHHPNATPTYPSRHQPPHSIHIHIHLNHHLHRPLGGNGAVAVGGGGGGQRHVDSGAPHRAVVAVAALSPHAHAVHENHGRG